MLHTNMLHTKNMGKYTGRINVKFVIKALSRKEAKE